MFLGKNDSTGGGFDTPRKLEFHSFLDFWKFARLLADNWKFSAASDDFKFLKFTSEDSHSFHKLADNFFLLEKFDGLFYFFYNLNFLSEVWVNFERRKPFHVIENFCFLRF